VTLDTDMSVGSQSVITLLQDGTVNGQMKYTAISDNEGALMWTPGMAPSNSGNTAIDGSVTVTVPLASEVVANTSHNSATTAPKSVSTVHKITPSYSIDPAVARTVVATSSLVVGATTPAEELAPISVVTLPAMPAEAPIEAYPTVTSPPVEVTPTASVVSGIPRVTDSGTSLSLATVATSKAASPTVPSTSSGRSPTNALDEMYRLLGTLPSGSAGYGSNLGSGGADSSDDDFDIWGLEELLVDQD
jgi:hypothetical protein